MRATGLSLNMAKLLALLLVIMPFLLAIEAQSPHSGAPAYHLRMTRQRRVEARSFMSWLTHISSKASDWVFGSVSVPKKDDSLIPKPAVGGVSVLPKMPYPYATGMIPRLASETLNGDGLVGGWICMHITPPADAGTDDGADSGALRDQQAGAGTGAGGATGGFAGAGAFNGAAPGGPAGTGLGGGTGGFNGAGTAGAGPAGGFNGGAGANPAYGSQQGFYPAVGGQQQAEGAGAGAGAGGQQAAGGYYNGGAGAGTGAGGAMMNGGGGMYPGGMAGGGAVGGGGAMNGGSAMGGGGAMNGGSAMGGGGAMNGGSAMGGGGAMNGDGAMGGGGAQQPTQQGAAAGDTVPAGYIRYNGQLMTIDQYQQALASSGSSSPSLSRRDLLHKRQFSDAAPAKTPAKILMCINGDPAVAPIKFNTMTGLHIRDASDKQDGVVAITNLPNYQMPWMPFLPTEEMWAEQQTLMLAQEKMIEQNMTTAAPPSR